MEAQPPFECVSKSSSGDASFSNRKHMTPSLDHKVGNGIFINPRSILRMRMERASVMDRAKVEIKSRASLTFVELQLYANLGRCTILSLKDEVPKKVLTWLAIIFHSDSFHD